MSVAPAQFALSRGMRFAPMLGTAGADADAADAPLKPQAAHSSVAAGPTHESMAQRGWQPAQSVVDPHSGRRGTLYVNPRSLPKPQRDRRPLAEDMNKPNPRLIQLQGGWHSSDPVITRDLMQGRPGLTHDRDGTNDAHRIQEYVRADDYDRAVRSVAMTQGGLPEKERETGNKAGFWGLHNLMRLVPYLPPQLRDLLQNQDDLRIAHSADANVGGVRATVSTHRPTHRPGARQRAAQTALEHAGTATHGPHGEQTRAAPLRHTHGKRDEIITQPHIHTGGGSGAESRVKIATHVPRQEEQVKRDDDHNLRENHGMHSAERLPQESMLPLPMRLETPHATNRRINAGTHDARGLVAQPTKYHGHEQSLSATARGIVQRLAAVMPGARPATESERAVPMRHAQTHKSHATRMQGTDAAAAGVVGTHARLYTTQKFEAAKLPPAPVRGLDWGESGAAYLERAQQKHMTEDDIAAATPAALAALASSGQRLPQPTFAA